ncbi:cytochrome C551 [Chryseobacterium scophthalmum]|uniref:cytochrome C551 n=1 Tax=Chryseobacterium scophthalmum TaxID=59733 RepID=UPI003D033B59
MKKLMLFAFGIGLVAASCGSKEPQMSSENKDSMNITADTSASKDSMPMKSQDTVKMPVDTVTAPVK